MRLWIGQARTGDLSLPGLLYQLSYVPHTVLFAAHVQVEPHHLLTFVGAESDSFIPSTTPLVCSSHRGQCHWMTEPLTVSFLTEYTVSSGHLCPNTLHNIRLMNLGMNTFPHRLFKLYSQPDSDQDYPGAYIW